MKKTVAFLLAAVMLLLCSCGKDKVDSVNDTTESPVFKSADMLNITNFGTSYLDCLSRYNAVISAVESKIRILENEHNGTLKAADGDKYFLNDNYILTYFEPFRLNSFFLTEGFEENLTEERAKDYFAQYSNGADIRYEKSNDGVITLYFISEDAVKKICVEYVRGTDSFRYTASTDSNDTVTVEETLEFVKAAKNIYLIQTQKTRCYVEFDNSGKIVYICCSSLKNSIYSETDRIYNTKISADRNWAKSLSKGEYLHIHTFENGVLTHEECSSGPWKTVTINESDYASAFIF